MAYMWDTNIFFFEAKDRKNHPSIKYYPLIHFDVTNVFLDKNKDFIDLWHVINSINEISRFLLLEKCYQKLVIRTRYELLKEIV